MTTTCTGERFHHLLRRGGHLGLFSYAQNQRIKAASTGPDLREVLLETRDGMWGYRLGQDDGLDLSSLFESPLLIRLADRFGWTMPKGDADDPRPPDPLALESPGDVDLEAALNDIEEQIEAWANELRWAATGY
ncbi:hypothetical protein [Rubrivirga sp.]|uniref:hypothetical protein n=1 Tax=Rubrivirga sp. TaxID=1885344 RepID=UPI003C756DCE